LQQMQIWRQNSNSARETEKQTLEIHSLRGRRDWRAPNPNLWGTLKERSRLRGREILWERCGVSWGRSLGTCVKR
jgi:hypothetical protein